MNAITKMTPTTDPGEDGLDLGQAVRDTALLADITIRLWLAERTDHEVTAKIKHDANAVGNVGRMIKNLLSGADTEYRHARSAYAAVRGQHYALTLPWVSDPHAERQRGPRLLPTLLWDNYLQAMGRKKLAAEQALDAFIASYPERIEQAKANLAGLARDQDYPTPEAVRGQFTVSFDFEPIPAGNAFKGLPKSTLAKLDLQLQRRQERMLASATAAMWQEARDRLERLAERASGDPKGLRESTVVAAQELALLLPGWNVSNDERALGLAAEVEAMLAHTSGATLRGNDTMRGHVATRARALVGQLDQWGV